MILLMNDMDVGVITKRSEQNQTIVTLFGRVGGDTRGFDCTTMQRNDTKQYIFYNESTGIVFKREFKY